MRKLIRKKRSNHLPVHNVVPRKISEKPKRMPRSLNNLRSQQKLSRVKRKRMNLRRKRNLRSQPSAKRLNQRSKTKANLPGRLPR